MPLDQGSLQKVIKDNDEVTERVNAMSKELRGVDPKNYEQMSSTAKQWTQNVHDLKANFDKQGGLSQALREGARGEEDKSLDGFGDKYRFVMERLKTDIRFFFRALQEFVDLPQDFTKQKTWDHFVHGVELDLKKIPTTCGDFLTSMDSIVTLLNFRDSICSELFNAMLFKKAVLDWDFKSSRPYADGPMVDVFKHVQYLFSKNETLPAKMALQVPGLFQAGPFTYESDCERMGDRVQLSPYQNRLITTLREMDSLDKGLRNMKFGGQVTVEDDPRRAKGSKTIMASELRAEVTKWFEEAQQLNHKLQSAKAQKHAPEDDLKKARADMKREENQKMQLAGKVSELETKVLNLTNEVSSMRRERTDLLDRNQKLSKEKTEALEKINKLLEKSKGAVDVLTADAELLSSMFRKQVQENRKNIEARDETRKELKQVQRDLDLEREVHKFQEDELQKKETLYLRTMAARKSMHESYLEQKLKITEIEEKMKQRDADWQQMLSVVDGRDCEGKHLKEDLRRAHQRIDELEQQKMLCVTEFKKATGRPFNTLLEQFKAELTSPPSALDPPNSSGSRPCSMCGCTCKATSS